MSNLYNPNLIIWCNLCNADAAVGKLTVVDENDIELVLDACQECVNKIPKKDWI